jgi:hypothetical protein
MWSPDSTVLIVSGRDQDGYGTWRVDPTTGQRTNVLSFALSTPAWSVDGSQVVALRPTSPSDITIEELVVVDADRLLEKAP